MRREDYWFSLLTGIWLAAGGRGVMADEPSTLPDRDRGSPVTAPAPATQPAGSAAPSTAPTTGPATRAVATRPQPSGRLPYTAPGARFQAMTLVSVSVPYAAAPGLNVSQKEAAESSVAASASVVGRPGLSAPPSRLGVAVVSRPGLAEGPARGLAYGSRFNNVLSPRANPLTGPNGRCGDLSRAGFFGGSRAGCEQRFRR